MANMRKWGWVGEAGERADEVRSTSLPPPLPVVEIVQGYLAHKVRGFWKQSVALSSFKECSGKTVGGTLLRLGTFTKNGRLHVLKINDKNLSKTLLSHQNRFS